MLALFSLETIAKPIVLEGLEIYQGKTQKTSYSHLEIDFDNCIVKNYGTKVFGTCSKLSNNLVMIYGAEFVQAFTRNNEGKIVSVLLRDLSDGTQGLSTSNMVIQQ